MIKYFQSALKLIIKMSKKSKKEMARQVVVTSYLLLPVGDISLSAKVGLSFLTACFNSKTLSYVFLLVSYILSSNLFKVYPCCITISFRF